MVIGLTGGIGTGKSTVSRILREKGFTVIDLDDISHEVIGFPWVVEKIAEKFGEEVIENDVKFQKGKITRRSVSRKKLGKIIFQNKEKRLILNSIMHPEILRAMKEKILELKKTEKIIFVEIQLLFEVGWEKEFDSILLVSADKDTQVRRILERDDRTEGEALDIISSQIPLEQKREKSNYIIENDGSIEDLKKKVDEFLKFL